MSIFNKLPFLKKKKHATPAKIVVTEHSVSRQSEGYVRLRDNILYMNADGNKKVIQLESALAHEGKTTVACNLAVSLGFTDKKVVVVDLDFRRPRVHRAFGLLKDKGIAEYILGDVKKEDLIKHTSYKNVDIVTRGAEIYNSSLVFISDKFKELMQYLRDNYDYVIVDCAPVLQVSDYIHISKVSDGILFVVAYGITTKVQVTEAIKELKKNNAEILGSVFSMYDMKKDSSYSSGYYNKYYNIYNNIYTTVDTDKEDEALEKKESK